MPKRWLFFGEQRIIFFHGLSDINARAAPLKSMFSTVHVYFSKGIQAVGTLAFSTRHAESKNSVCKLYILQWLQTQIFHYSPFLTRFESHPLRHSFIAFANHVF